MGRSPLFHLSSYFGSNQTSLLLMKFYEHVRTNIVFPRFRRFRNFHPMKARWLNMQDNSNAALAVETSQNFSFFNLPLASRVWLGSSFCCRAEVKKRRERFPSQSCFSLESQVPNEAPLQSGPDHRSAAV